MMNVGHAQNLAHARLSGSEDKRARKKTETASRHVMPSYSRPTVASGAWVHDRDWCIDRQTRHIGYAKIIKRDNEMSEPAKWPFRFLCACVAVAAFILAL